MSESHWQRRGSSGRRCRTPPRLHAAQRVVSLHLQQQPQLSRLSVAGAARIAAVRSKHATAACALPRSACATFLAGLPRCLRERWNTWVSRPAAGALRMMTGEAGMEEAGSQRR